MTTPEKIDALAAAKLGRLKNKPAVAPLIAWGKLSDQEPLFIASAAVVAAGLLKDDPRLTRAGLRMGAAEALATLVKTVIKHSVDRTRPRVMVESGRYESGRGAHDEGDYNSFPSGHSAGAIAVARSIVREYPAAAPLAYTGAGAAGVAQVFYRSHYPADVVAGFVVGLVAEAIVDRGFARMAEAAPTASRPTST